MESKNFDIEVPDAPECMVETQSCADNPEAKKNHPKVLVEILHTMGGYSNTQKQMVVALNDIKGCVQSSLEKIDLKLEKGEVKMASLEVEIAKFNTANEVRKERDKRIERTVDSLAKRFDGHEADHVRREEKEDDRKFERRKIWERPIAQIIVTAVIFGFINYLSNQVNHDAIEQMVKKHIKQAAEISQDKDDG